MQYVVVAENGKSALELVGAAQTQGAERIMAILGCPDGSDSLASSGIDKVIVVSFPSGVVKDAIVEVVVEQAKAAGEATILFGSDKRLVNVAGLCAQRLGTIPVVDVRKIEDGAAFHMLYGGKAMVGERPRGSYSVFVMQGGAYGPAAIGGSPCMVETVEAPQISGIAFVETKAKETQSVDLTAAKRIVSIGRGVNSQEGFAECVALKNALDAEMGCTRPVTETENPLLERSLYIGASGVSCKPELFVSIASSGQSQHTMGMYESGTVVAIDKNPDALFFQQADYGIVGDYREVVPALVEALGA